MNDDNVNLEFCEVSFQYNKKEMLHDKLSFQIKKNEIVSILGPSGTGKSTLLKLANRLLEISSGCIRYLGKDIKEISPLKLRKELGYLPQVPYLIEGTVRDNLLLAFSQKELPVNLDEIISKAMLEVGLQEKYISKPSHELSVGEKQRVALARTILNQSKILLLDEPNSALDQDNSQILVKTLKNLVKEKEISIIIVTHQLDFAKQMSGRYLVLRNAEITEVNDPDMAFQKKEESI